MALVAYGYTGSAVVYNVTVTKQYAIALWGAGAGAGRYSGTTCQSGGGGFTLLRVNLAAGDVLTVEVGQGGGPGIGTGTIQGGYGGWPDGGWGARGNMQGGGGGGSSRVWLNGTLLAVAGNETTRNATTHGMVAMLEHPEQWELFKRERPETAYDEILRWASPITQFQRTAMEDTEIGGLPIAKGDRVLICYGSANFDEEVFDDPFTFTILRDPNPHVTFGGQGPHYCLGANLAKMQLELIFNAVADHLPDLTALGDPKRLRSGWLNGLTEWKVDLGVCPVAS